MTNLSSRERTLLIGVGAIVALLLNLILLSAFARKNAALRADLALGQAQQADLEQSLQERDLWAKRDAWVSAKQPRLTNESAAGVELLDLIRTIAGKTHLTIENPALGSAVNEQWAKSVSVSVDTHSSWPDLIRFLQTMQQPDQFIVFENAHIQVDAADPTKMQGQFKIARWYAL